MCQLIPYTLFPHHSCIKTIVCGLLSPLFSCGVFIWCNHPFLKLPFRAFFLSGFTKKRVRGWSLGISCAIFFNYSRVGGTFPERLLAFFLFFFFTI